MSIFTDALATSLRSAVLQPARSYIEFFESEITIPTGKYRGMPFDVDVQPITRLLLAELNNERWNEIVVTGPSQSGKTTIGFTGPLLFVAAELGEPVVIGLPDGNMAGNKWEMDILPILTASPTLRDLIPDSGPGSRGGKITDTIRLANGAVIKFMTRGGSDQSKAGFPGCRFLRVTEAAGFSHAKETSVEADPFRQIKARLSSYDLDETQTIIEGTVTLEDELPWRLREQSTRSRILSPCPHCSQWISPEREDFIGWQDAETEYEAAESGMFHCPECGEGITDEQRRESLQRCVLVHDGQHVTRTGRVSGPVPPTSRLWFRWSAWHNCLVSSRTLAVREWMAAQLDEDSRERDDAERELMQFVWCQPYVPKRMIVAPLTARTIDRTVSDLEKGLLPSDTERLTVAVDVGMYWCHWTAIAWRQNKTGHIAEYGRFPVLEYGEGTAESRKAAVKLVLQQKIQEFADRCSRGWPVDERGDRLAPARVWIDSGWMEDAIFAAVANLPDAFFPCIGRGTGQLERRKYTHPASVDRSIRYIGERYHIRRNSKHRRLYVVVDADYWKTQTSDALQVDRGGDGSMTLFADPQSRHKTFKRHMTAEELVRQFHPRHGAIEVWENKNDRPNHYFDSTYMAVAAGHHAASVSVLRPPEIQQNSWFRQTRGARS